MKKDQINRQDFVDNAIYELVEKLNNSNVELRWDQNHIAQIREEIDSYIRGYDNAESNYSPFEFYPWIVDEITFED